MGECKNDDRGSFANRERRRKECPSLTLYSLEKAEKGLL
jgi:hypothetical protein